MCVHNISMGMHLNSQFQGYRGEISVDIEWCVGNVLSVFIHVISDRDHKHVWICVIDIHILKFNNRTSADLLYFLT